MGTEFNGASGAIERLRVEISYVSGFGDCIGGISLRTRVQAKTWVFGVLPVLVLTF